MRIDWQPVSAWDRKWEEPYKLKAVSGICLEHARSPENTEVSFDHFTGEESEAHRGQVLAKATVPTGCPPGDVKLAPGPQSGDCLLEHSGLCVHWEGRLKLFKSWKLMKYEIMCDETRHSPAFHRTGNWWAPPVSLKLSLTAGLSVRRGERGPWSHAQMGAGQPLRVGSCFSGRPKLSCLMCPPGRLKAC